MKTQVFFIIIMILMLSELYGEKNTDNDSRIVGYRKEYKKKKNNSMEIKRQNFSHKMKKSPKIIPEPIPPVTIEDPADKKGVIIESPGYVGETKEGKKHGKGKLVLRNGDVYIGAWKNGKRSGQGVYIYSSGIKYNGQWKNDVMDGSGSFIIPGTGSYYGDIKEGQMTGFGVFNYNDGSVYEGYWKNGKWHGKGKYSLPDGRYLEAVFAEHQLIKILSQTEISPEMKEGYSGKE